MQESFDQISIITLTTVFQTLAAIGIGFVALLSLVCSAGIAWQMAVESNNKPANLKQRNNFGLLRG